MFKLLLISVVVVPVLLGMQAARSHSVRHGLFLLLAAIFIYDLFYFLMLYYIGVRWVGWGAGAV
jgi:hypothetical protein